MNYSNTVTNDSQGDNTDSHIESSFLGNSVGSISSELDLEELRAEGGLEVISEHSEQLSSVSDFPELVSAVQKKQLTNQRLALHCLCYEISSASPFLSIIFFLFSPYHPPSVAPYDPPSFSPHSSPSSSPSSSSLPITVPLSLHMTLPLSLPYFILRPPSSFPVSPPLSLFRPPFSSSSSPSICSPLYPSLPSLSLIGIEHPFQSIIYAIFEGSREV